MKQLSLCWCYDNHTNCSKEEDFDSEITKLQVYSPVAGVSHECTYDSTCLMRIEDIPLTEPVSFTPQLVVRSDCSGEQRTVQ